MTLLVDAIYLAADRMPTKHGPPAWRGVVDPRRTAPVKRRPQDPATSACTHAAAAERIAAMALTIAAPDVGSRKRFRTSPRASWTRANVVSFFHLWYLRRQPIKSPVELLRQ